MSKNFYFDKYNDFDYWVNPRESTSFNRARGFYQKLNNLTLPQWINLGTIFIWILFALTVFRFLFLYH